MPLDPIQQFNQLYQAGDYAGAGQLAAAQGYTPDQVTGYVNNTFGTNYTTANVAPFMTGIATPMANTAVAAPAPVYGPEPVVAPPAAPALLSSTDEISRYYQDELGRNPDVGGLNYWANQVNSGAMTLDQVRQAINTSAEGTAFDANPLTGSAALGNWLTQNPTATDAQIAYHMDLFGVSPEQAGSVFTGVKPEDIQRRYQAATPYVNLFNTFQAGDVAATNAALLESGLTPDQLASGYLLDPAELQALRAQGYNLGIAAPEITQAFAPPPPIQPAPGEQRIVGWNAWVPILGPAEPTQQDFGFEGLNKAFEWAQANKVDDVRLKEVLGEDTYNKYVQQYGQGILAGLQPALADNNLSAEEALEIGSQAKKYGLDAADIAKYTGLKAELPQQIFDAYDRTLTGIVGNLLDPKSTASEVDRAKTALALQAKYGLTDADLAKYTDGKWTETQVKDYFEPVRNFQTDLKTALSGPDTTAKDALSFIDKAQSNSLLNGLYGDKLTEFENGIAALTPKWERFGVDPLQAETLYSQINKITEAAGGQNWQGSWMSGGDNAALEAAARLQKLGVDSLADLKVTPQITKEKAVELYMGQPVTTDAQGRKMLSYTDEYGNTTTTPLPAGAQTTLARQQIGYGGGESQAEYVDYVPLTADEQKTLDPKTGEFDFVTGQKLIDASTGKVVATGGTDNRFVIDNYETGNFFKGSDKTFGIQFTKDGVPVPFTTTEKTGLVTTPILPFLATILGVPGMIGEGLASLAPSALATGSLANMAVSNAIMSGGIAALTDQNVGKAMLGGAVTPVVSSLVGGMLPTDLPSGVSKAITSTAGNVAGAAARGTPVEDVLKSGILSGAVNYGLDLSGLTQSLNLSPQDLKLLSGVIVPALTTGKVNPLTAISALTPTGKP